MNSIQHKSDIDQWNLIIKHHKKWWDLQLQDVWRYRGLIALFVRWDFVSRYKQTILGPLWLIIQPILTSLTFTYHDFSYFYDQFRYTGC
jgi:lipopolysaccharide transport system permease protein